MCSIILLYCCRSLNDIKDREICCYSISCKERENIGELTSIGRSTSPCRHTHYISIWLLGGIHFFERSALIIFFWKLYTNPETRRTKLLWHASDS